jgi:hypothetical protein
LYEWFGPEILAHFIFHGNAGGMPSPMYAAGNKLEGIGSKAEPAVPIILEYLEARYGDELPEYSPTSNQALRVLTGFSGEDFGRDVNAWVRWWENYNE